MELEGLGELGKSAEETTESLNGLNKELEDTSSGLKKAGDASATFGDKVMAAGTTVLKTTIGLAQLSNQLDQLNLQHQQFDKIWQQRFMEFQNKKVGAEINVEKATMAYNKAKDTLIPLAKIKKELSDIELKEAEELSLNEANLRVRQATLGVITAGLALRQAEINESKADLDYQNQLMSIEGGLINARKAAADAIKNYVKEVAGMFEPWVKLDDAAATYTKTIGGSAHSMQELKKETLDYANASHLQAKYNISAEELIKLQTKYNSELGRSIKLTNDEKESLGALKKIYGDESAVKFATSFTNFGYDLNRASGLAGKLYAEASKHGVSVEKFSKNLLSNIKMAQTLTFAKGVKGLQNMAERATELNFNMQETAKAAEKLSTLEGAMNASAQLSVLGGNFAQFSNPLAMMNEALNDAEGLQERIVQQFSDLAHWDSKKGEITMEGTDRMRLKTAAQAMGMDPTELSNMVFTKARQDKLSPEINNLGLNDDLKHLLRNVAQLDENGNGYVDIGGRKTSLEEASTMDPDKLAKILRTQNNSDSDNIKDIAQAVTSINDRVEGYMKAIGDSLSEGIDNSGVGKEFSDMIAYQSTSSDFLKNMTDEQREAYMESARFNEKNAKWTYEYQTGVNGALKALAGIQREQTKYGVQNAQYALEGAQYAKRHAEYNEKKAPLRLHQQKLENLLAQYSESEAKLQLAELDISLKNALMQRDFGIPLAEEQLKQQYIAAKRLNDLYQVQASLAKMEAYNAMSNVASSIGSLLGGPIAGWITKQVAGGITNMMGAYQILKSLPTSMKGMTENGYDVISKGDKFNAKDYDLGDEGKKYTSDGSNISVKTHYDKDFATGGIVRSDSAFYDGGYASIARVGGVLIGPSHANGGVTINAQGGEYIMPVDQTNMYRSELEAMRSKTFPVGNGGFNSMKVENYNGDSYNSNFGSNNGTNNINLTLNGTITLDLSGNTANIDATKLLEDGDFIRKITSLISHTQINRSNYGVASERTMFSPLT